MPFLTISSAHKKKSKWQGDPNILVKEIPNYGNDGKSEPVPRSKRVPR